MQRTELIAKLRAQRDLFDREQVRSVALFGSRARGDYRPDSDVDLLVEYRAEARVSLVGVGRLERLLTEEVGAPVQVVIGPLKTEQLSRNAERDRVDVL